MSLLLLFNQAILADGRNAPPVLTLQSILEFAGSVPDGKLVAGVSVPWFTIIDMIRRDPESMYQISCEKWEELIAGAYERAGFDEVILTPRSGDLGRDVVASINGIGAIRIFDQVKAYSPGHVVTANDVRALSGVLAGAQNVSKGVITTTAEFAPGVMSDPFLAPLMPFRLELKPREKLLKWLDELSTPSVS
jgi:restriction system protein